MQEASKIASVLPPQLREFCHTTVNTISTYATPQAITRTLDKTHLFLLKAIKNHYKVNMSYNSLYEGKIIALELSPYRLMFHQRAWYVIGSSDLYEEPHTFKLGRILNMKRSVKRFVPDKDFDLVEYIGKAWGMIREGRIYDVKLRCLPMVATNVEEVHWHSTQKTTRNVDGSIIAEFRVDGLREIMWWILGYGDQVEILAPTALRKMVIKRLEDAIKLNTDNKKPAE